MLRKWTVLGLMLSALATNAAAATDAAGPVISGAGARRGVDVTVYNQDMALVRETRTVDLPAGDVRLEFRDVPARINPVTLLVTGGCGRALRTARAELRIRPAFARTDPREVRRAATWPGSRRTARVCRERCSA
jgi:hypothetical protein